MFLLDGIGLVGIVYKIKHPEGESVLSDLYVIEMVWCNANAQRWMNILRIVGNIQSLLKRNFAKILPKSSHPGIGKHSICLLILMALIGSLAGANPRAEVLFAQFRADNPEMKLSDMNGTQRFTHSITGQIQPLILIRDGGIHHFGLDLGLGKNIGSATIGNLLEQYLLAYLMKADTKGYPIRAKMPQLSERDFSSKIFSLQDEMQIEIMQTNASILDISILNSNLQIDFSIDTELSQLYGMDKKDLEQDLWDKLKRAPPNEIQIAPPIPDWKELIPYGKQLYAQEISSSDSAFVHTLFWINTPLGLEMVYDAALTKESLMNFFLQPEAFEPKPVVKLQQIMYGGVQQNLTIGYRELLDILGRDLQIGLAITENPDGKLAIALLCYDSLSGVRHLLSGTIDPLLLFNNPNATIDMKLHAWITGSANDKALEPQKIPRWEIKTE